MLNAVNAILKRVNQREDSRDIFEDKWTVSEKIEQILKALAERGPAEILGVVRGSDEPDGSGGDVPGAAGIDPVEATVGAAGGRRLGKLKFAAPAEAATGAGGRARRSRPSTEN